MSDRELTLGQALDLGVEHAMAGRHQDAIGLFRGVLTHEPDNFEAIERLGASLFEMNRLHEALYWFWRGRKLNRRHPLALTNYGLAVGQLGHPEEGVVELQKAVYQLERNPQASAATKSLCYNNLGNTLERLGRHKEALATLDKGIAFNPDDPFPHYNRGIALLRLNRHHEALDALNRSLALQGPVTDSTSRLNAADALYNRGMARLLLGDLKGGFADYEARLLTTENQKPNLGMPAEKKLTPDTPIEGKSILVISEQGLGDDIQFFRFLPLLNDRGPRELQIVAHRATKVLLEGAPVTIRNEGEPLEYDHWVALMSLPYILRIDETNLPAPYLPQFKVGDDEGLQNYRARLARWRDTLDLPHDKVNVGVCWSGNFRHKNDRHRSIPIEDFARVFDTPGCNVISLQQLRPGEVEAFAQLQAKKNITALGFNDFRDTAAVITNLDVVLSVDTAVAHLSATLSVPTKILIPAFSTDWRWQLHRTDSPWYPSATLYRQPKIGDWDTAIETACNDLAFMAETRGDRF